MQSEVRHHLGVPKELLPVHAFTASCGHRYSGGAVNCGAHSQDHGWQGNHVHLPFPFGPALPGPVFLYCPHAMRCHSAPRLNNSLLDIVAKQCQTEFQNTVVTSYPN